ncbi:MAG: Guanylate kinase [Calditrichaeota bacterium]|nr:Guanylate kinase [Calditrichota bacterium]
MSRERERKGRPFVFSGASGAGKTTITRELMRRVPNLQFSVSSTTRPRREGERDGVDYDFLTREQFEHFVEQGDFVEYETVHGYLYGTRVSKVEPLLDAGVDVVFDLDVLGALSIRRLFRGAFLVYIDVLDREVLRRRLIQRHSEDEAEIRHRLQRYQMEKKKAAQFDRIVINDDLERAVAEVAGIIESVRSSTES